jgi:hypothetical protein
MGEVELIRGNRMSHKSFLLAQIFNIIYFGEASKFGYWDTPIQDQMSTMIFMKSISSKCISDRVWISNVTPIYLHSAVAQCSKFNYPKYSKNKLVTVKEEDVPYASAVINFKNAQRLY